LVSSINVVLIYDPTVEEDMGPLIGAILLFMVAALLYYQSHSTEAFRTEAFENSNPIPIQPPVAGRPYGAEGERATQNWRVPADLNRAPVAVPSTTNIPISQNRPNAIPGAMTAPRESMAERKDLYELDSKISTWLFAATQRESDHPGSLTSEQLQRRVILQARLANVRGQLVNDMITSTYKQVAQETADLRRENAGWGRLAPNLEAIHSFASHVPADAFLTVGQYAEFRALFDAALNELKGHTQPNPLERVRLQQLELIQQDLIAAERQFSSQKIDASHPAVTGPTYAGPPPIRVGQARLFLQQSLRPDQPLPTLFALEPRPDQMPTSNASNPVDVISQLRDIQWRLTVSYNPAEQELKREIAALLRQLQSGPTPVVVEAARSATAELTHRLSPVGASVAQPQTHPTAGLATSNMLGYDPKDLQKRANRLCYQIHEAFPRDAEALGCPPPNKPIATDLEAESAINIVCDRLHYSVPSVSPAQFGCPLRPV
jgi:hypothetical protein